MKEGDGQQRGPVSATPRSANRQPVETQPARDNPARRESIHHQAREALWA